MSSNDAYEIALRYFNAGRIGAQMPPVIAGKEIGCHDAYMLGVVYAARACIVNGAHEV